ncbi:hypothetical protein CALCODRAFT_436466, partial [Calocera cornea HHB12733]
LQLILDVCTRWSSTYAMVTCALELCSSLEAVLLIPEHAENLAHFWITATSWKGIQDLANILECAHKGRQRLSADSYPTLFMAIPALEAPMAAWEKLQKTTYARDKVMQEFIEAGIWMTSAYYLKMEKTDAYAIAMILTP